MGAPRDLRTKSFVQDGRFATIRNETTNPRRPVRVERSAASLREVATAEFRRWPVDFGTARLRSG
jgi:hypothetical protein